MRNVVVLKGDREKSIGLIGMSPIPPDTYFVFENVLPGTLFHSQGVLEPFDIAFLDGRGKPLLVTEIMPPAGVITAPPGTQKVVESKAGYLQGLRGMGNLTPDSSDVAKALAVPLVSFLIGSGIVYFGHQRKNTASGYIFMGAGTGMAIISAIAGIRKYLSLKS